MGAHCCGGSLTEIDPMPKKVAGCVDSTHFFVCNKPYSGSNPLPPIWPTIHLVGELQTSSTGSCKSMLRSIIGGDFHPRHVLKSPNRRYYLKPLCVYISWASPSSLSLKKGGKSFMYKSSSSSSSSNVSSFMFLYHHRRELGELYVAVESTGQQYIKQ